MALCPLERPISLHRHLLEVRQRLVDSVRVFNRLYRDYGGRMETAARQFQELTQNETDAVTMVCVVLGVLGLGVATALVTRASGIAAPLRMALSATLGTLALLGAAMTYLTNRERDTSSMDIVGEQAQNFAGIIERLRDSMQNIKEASEEFQQKSSLLMSGRGVEARNLLNNEQFQQLLKQTAELAKRSGEAFGMADSVMMGVREVRDVIADISPIEPTPEGNAKLRRYMEDTALQSKKLVREFKNLQVFLQNFEQMLTKSDILV